MRSTGYAAARSMRQLPAGRWKRAICQWPGHPIHQRRALPAHHGGSCQSHLDAIVRLPPGREPSSSKPKQREIDGAQRIFKIESDLVECSRGLMHELCQFSTGLAAGGVNVLIAVNAIDIDREAGMF